MSRIVNILGPNWKNSLKEIFKEVRKIHSIEANLRDVTVGELKRRKRLIKPHAELLKGTYHYNSSTRLPILLKIPEEPEEATYEKNIIKLISSEAGYDYLSRIYALLNGKQGEKVLVMESCTKKDFIDFGSNSLESKLMSYDSAVKKEQEEKVEKLKARRPEMFRKIAKTLATHVKIGYLLLEAAKFFESQTEKEKVKFEVDGEKVCIPVKGKKYFRERFLERTGLILDYLGVNSKTREKYLAEGRELIFRRFSEKRKDIFDWAEFQPYTIVHGNLKGANILITYNGDVKIIDWRRASVASCIVDQIFAYNPNPAKTVPDFEAEKIQEHFLKCLREPVKLGENIEVVLGETKDPEYVLNFKEAVRLRLFYEGIRRASDISKFAEKVNDKNLSRRDKKYVKSFENHLSSSGKLLNEFILEDYVTPKYSSLRDIKNWLIKTPIGPYMWK